jgi:quercetin 2,3-dioxygenase
MNTTTIHPAEDRLETRLSWLQGRHSFSFGGQYEPGNVGHGLLLVNNDDLIAPGTGFDTHPHQDMEIVTWVLEGELEHKDSEGNRGLLYPGLAQRMSAGTGIWHSEKNFSKEKRVHLVQMWVQPDTERIQPGYEQLDINAELAKGGLVPIASGAGHDAAIAIRQRGAVLWGARMRADETIAVPDSQFAHVFVPKGTAALDDSPLLAGDAARLINAGSPTITAGPEGAEILIWSMGN